MVQLDVVKQKWYQQIQRDNMIKNIITNILVPILTVGGVGMAFYSSMMENEKVIENMRIADSLRVEVNKYHQKYDSLLVIAGKLDAKIADEERRIDSLRKHPPIARQPKPPIQTPDSAVNFLNDFIKD